MGVSVVFRVGGNPFLHSESLRIKHVTRLSFLRKNLRKYKKYIQAKLIARFSDLIIVVNNTTKKVLLNRAYKNVAVVPQYIKMTPPKSKKTYEQRNYNDDKNIVRFVTVTNLNSEEKARGVRLLIRLLHAWSQRNSKNIAFTIFGDGEHKGIVEEAAEEYRSGNYNVIDAGFVKSVQETIIEHDIFLYYSRVDTTCNAILEAMAGGLPVIVNVDDNFKEYIEHKWNGLLFDEEDSFMDAVGYLYENERRRVDIGSKGRETIQMCFSLAAVQEKLTKVLG